MRHPDRVHIHRVPAARVAGVAVPPARRGPPGVAWWKRNEIGYDRIAGISGGQIRDEREFPQKERQAGLATVGRVKEERALALGGNCGIGEPTRHQHRELELIVNHVIVLAHPPQLAEYVTGRG